MRTITRDIEINIDGSRIGFRLSKLDAFSGVMLLRLLISSIMGFCICFTSLFVFPAVPG